MRFSRSSILDLGRLKGRAIGRRLAQRHLTPLLISVAMAFGLVLGAILERSVLDWWFVCVVGGVSVSLYQASVVFAKPRRPQPPHHARSLRRWMFVLLQPYWAVFVSQMAFDLKYPGDQLIWWISLLVVAITGIASIVIHYSIMARVRRLNYIACPECRYSLVGMDRKGLCPECGDQYDVATLEQRWLTN